ncbi:MAG: pilus assembly protein [Anaerolineae bacterium]|nr:pilus assembly protein [Anaerolineae bacterium]
MKKQKQLGQALLETALVLPILIVILGGVFEVGRALLILIAVENAAAEGALYGATHPACLTTDHAATICQGTESVAGRVREESKPIIDLSAKNSVITVEVEGDGVVTADAVLRVDVETTFSPLTPLGLWLWGKEAHVQATARQKVLSPPPPGYQY